MVDVFETVTRGVLEATAHQQAGESAVCRCRLELGPCDKRDLTGSEKEEKRALAPGLSCCAVTYAVCTLSINTAGKGRTVRHLP